MAKKAAFTVKKVISVLAILAVFVGFVVAGVYLYVFPTLNLEALFNPNKIVEAPERERMYEITDEFISAYYGVEYYSELAYTGSQEWLESAMQTLKDDQASFVAYDPLHTRGEIIDTYNELSKWELILMRQYDSLYRDPPEDGWDKSVGGFTDHIPPGVAIEDADYMYADEMWEKLFTCYDAFKAADTEYQASLAEEAAKSAESEG